MYRGLCQGWNGGAEEGSSSEPGGCQKVRPAYWGQGFAKVPHGPRKGCPTHIHPSPGAGTVLAPP